ncbi:hypothetical protein GCM10009566_74210 [Streptomyces murinus]
MCAGSVELVGVGPGAQAAVEGGQGLRLLGGEREAEDVEVLADAGGGDRRGIVTARQPPAGVMPRALRRFPGAGSRPGIRGP